jgi:hypothetical protein
LNNWIGKDGLGWSGSVQDLERGSFEKDNEPTTCIKGLAFFDQLIDCQIFHEVTWSYIELKHLSCHKDNDMPFLKTAETSVSYNTKSKPRGKIFITSKAASTTSKSL